VLKGTGFFFSQFFLSTQNSQFFAPHSKFALAETAVTTLALGNSYLEAEVLF
jgi:hypothetical protein